LFTVVKATFTIAAQGGRPRVLVADEQLPIVVAPEYHGEPGASSVKRPSDVSLEKPGTDVLLLGSARAPNGEPVRTLDVGIAVGPVRSHVRVYGDRFWQADGVAFTMTVPEPFESMPLVWERAFGGRDRTEAGVVEEPCNPVGTGFRAPDGLEPVEGTRLPNIEDPTTPLSSWKQRPAPAGFAPIDAHWQPRRSFAGTYDERWQQERAPFLPADFDARFLQLAPPPLVAPGHLQGGEWVDMRGVTAAGALQFPLPSVRPRVTYRLDDGRAERPALLDTVILEPDAARLVLVWRAALTCDKKALRVREVETTFAGAA
ncbi:MAG: DUF2169 family type VI secretion system accessory protein, partial [Longimicrobiales bacterium]